MDSRTRRQVATLAALSILVSLLAVAPAAAQQPQPKIAPIAPLPPAARAGVSLPVPLQTVTMRIPVGGDPLEPPPIAIDPPAPLSPAQRAAIAPARTGAAPIRVPADRPRHYALTARQPSITDVAHLRISGLLAYVAHSEPARNGGNGTIILSGEGSVTLHFHLDRGARYMVEFGLERAPSARVTYALRSTRAPTGGDRDITFSDLRHRLLVVTEPAEATGWGSLSLWTREINGEEPGDAWATRPAWILYDVTVTRLDD